MRALARRALYLQQQLATVDRAQHHGDRWGYILEELAAIMIAVESLTARRGTDARPG